MSNSTTQNIQLLLIDPQNDFCDLPEPLRGDQQPALAVAGAHADMERVSRFIQFAAPMLNGITVTLDSHPFVAIERTTFWRDAAGNEVAPFTKITAADVEAGLYVPIHGDRIEPISQVTMTERVIELLTKLEDNGRYTLMVWPVHCVTATWGANIHELVAKQLAHYELQSRLPVRKVHKGEYPLVEHYGVFEAETPLWEVPSTRFNADLADKLTHGVDLLFVAGETSSHCVAASIDQLVYSRKRLKFPAQGIVLLTDCMSPVAGFEQNAIEFIARTVAAGGRAMTSAEAMQLLTA